MCSTTIGRASRSPKVRQMFFFSKFRRRRRSGPSSEGGYILIILMMIATMVVIGLTAMTVRVSHELQRDREEELIHRGVEYSRAIRHYYKRFGRYPLSLDDLKNTNNLRFLRKPYKDPITGQDFKLLHFGEVKLTFGPGIAGGVAPGANPVGGLNSDKSASSNSSSGQNQRGTQQSSNSADQSSSSSSGSDNSSSSSSSSGNQTFGGGPIVGVVSISTKESIREFNKKNHYNDWQFIYDPSIDRGGLLNTPAQPALQGPGIGQGQMGNPGMPNTGPTTAPGVPLPPPPQQQQ
jgi:type II secretory pathway pseudopilin PulG